jgi:hypothetical protein
LVNSLYPDVRKIVGCLQRFSSDGLLNINRDSLLTNEKIIISHTIEIISFIRNNEITKINIPLNNILNIIQKDTIDFKQVYSTLFFEKNIPVSVKIIINKYSNENSSSLIQEMHFMAMIYEIIQALSMYLNSIKK